MSPPNKPVWLCTFPGRPSTYVESSRPREAEIACRTEGLGTPSSITYAGYTAAPTTEEPRPSRPRRQLSSRRAELALTIYSVLRVDWPIGSILAPAKAAARFPSQSALKDFLADVGRAIERLEADHSIVDSVIRAEGLGWYYANRAKNARLQNDWTKADRAQEKKELYKARARRLRKRRAYQVAIGELMASLDGLLPSAATAAESFAAYLIAGGMAPDDVESLVRRLRRIAVPRL